jgi:hypothetical protein
MIQENKKIGMKICYAICEDIKPVRKSQSSTD